VGGRAEQSRPGTAVADVAMFGRKGEWKGEWKGGSFEQGGARSAGRAFGKSVGRWSGRYTSADGSSGRRALKSSLL